MTFDQVNLHLSHGEYEQAIDALKGIIDGGRSLTIEQLDARLYLTNIYGKLSKYEEAKAQAKEVVKIGHVQEHGVEMVQALALYGTMSMQNGTTDEGISFLNENNYLLPQLDYTQPQANLVTGMYYNALGTLQIDKGNFEVGNQNQELALEYLEKSGDKTQYSRSLYNIGASFTQQGRHDVALRYLNQAIELQTETGNLLGVGYSKMAMGEIYQKEGRLSQALECFQAEFDIFMEHGSLPQQSWAYTDMGNIYLTMGEIDKSIEFYMKGLPIYEEIGQKRTLANHLRAIATAYRLKGEYIISLNFNNQALELYLELGNNAYTSKAKLALSKDYLSLNDSQKALEEASSAMQLAEKEQLSDDMIRTIPILIQIYLALDDQTKVDDLYLKLQKLVDNNQGPLYKHILLNTGALINLHKGRIPDLNEALHDSISVLDDDITDPEQYIQALLTKSELHILELQFSTETQVINDLEDVIHRLSNYAVRERLAPLIIRSKLLIAKLCILKNELDMAISELQDAMEMARAKNYQSLYEEAENEVTLFESNRDSYAELLEQGANSSLIELIGVRQLITQMIANRRSVNMGEEIPVYFLLVSKEGKALYSKRYYEVDIEDQLVGGFLTALNSFASEAFKTSGSLERIAFKEYNILMQNIDLINICYIYKGDDLAALARVKNYTKRLLEDHSIVEHVQESLKQSKTLDEALMMSLLA